MSTSHSEIVVPPSPPPDVAGLLSVPAPSEIRKGVPSKFLIELADALELTDSDLERLMHISRQTLSRRKQQNQKLTALEADRLATLARVYNAALAFFDGDRDAAIAWLKHPAPALSQETPLNHSDTTSGAEAVMDVLAKLEYGIAV